MPHTSDSIIVTAAADSEVRIFDLNASSHLSHVYTCHSDSVKRIGINNTSPYEFLTCSEDGKQINNDNNAYILVSLIFFI